jgi:hypothetical protein
MGGGSGCRYSSQSLRWSDVSPHSPIPPSPDRVPPSGAPLGSTAPGRSLTCAAEALFSPFALCRRPQRSSRAGASRRQKALHGVVAMMRAQNPLLQLSSVSAELGCPAVSTLADPLFGLRQPGRQPLGRLGVLSSGRALCHQADTTGDTELPRADRWAGAEGRVGGAHHAPAKIRRQR